MIHTWRGLLFLSLISLAWSTSIYRPGQLMLLVIGSSAARPDRDQSNLLERVRALQAQPGLGDLKVATMHFDRPREAAFARQVLGVSAGQLPCVCLVELDASELRPVRSLFSWPSVTGARLAEVDAMAERWSRLLVPSQEESEPAMPYAFAPEPVAGPARPVAAAVRDRLYAGVNMHTQEWLRSPNGLYGCWFQPDGNLVVYRFDRTPHQPMWNSITHNRGAVSLRLSNDGVMRMVDATNQVLWEAGEPGPFSHCFVQMQNDGNLVIYRQDGNGLSLDWASNSNQGTDSR